MDRAADAMLRVVRRSTDRFVLTPFDADRDWSEFVVDIALDPNVIHYGPDIADADKRELAADEFVPWFAEGAERGFIVWTVRTPEGEFVGVTGLMTSEPPVGGPDPEFGCLFATRWHGRGVATETGIAVLDDAWARLPTDRIITVMDTPNLASRRLVDKLGFRFEEAVFDEDATAYLVFVLDRPVP